MTTNDLEAMMRGIAPVIQEYTAKAIQAATSPLLARVAALEARPGVEYAGVYDAAKTYAEGQLVTRSGGLWLALRTSTNLLPGSDPAFWKLVVKSGEAPR